MTAGKKTHWLRTTLIVLIACCIAGLALTTAMAVRHPEPACAVATVQFTFDGAAAGIAPNGADFDISEICSDPVLAEGLAGASLEDACTPSRLRASLIVLGRYPGGLSSAVLNGAAAQNYAAIRETGVGDYVPTAFDIALYGDFDPSISRAKLEELLRSILSAYRAHFVRTCSNGLQPEILLFDPEDYDCPHRLEILRSHYLTVARYARSMYDRYPDFHLDGVGFNDVSARLNALADGDIFRLEAEMIASGLSRDRERLLDQYDWEIRALTNRLEARTALLGNLDDLIGAYDKAGVLYVGNSGAMTRIGGSVTHAYDALIRRRRAISENLAALSADIGKLRFRLDAPRQEGLSPLPAETGDAEARTALLEDGLNDIAERGDALVAGFGEMLKACDLQQINEQTLAISDVAYSAPKLLSAGFVRRAIRTTGPLCALGFMACMVLIIISRRREQKA